jgi:prepilin-type N-terminal cleavage/methylation domain-containing protein
MAAIGFRSNGEKVQPLRGKLKIRQKGFSLIELVIAMGVLAFGLLGGIAVICAASASNGRSRINSMAATVAESTMEKILAASQGATSIRDCAGNVFSIDTELTSDPSTNPGQLDFAQPPLPGYSMQYVVCSTGAGMTFDVRWRVDPGPSPSTQTITVGAKLAGAGPAAAFTRPVTLRSLRGVQ